MFHKIKQYLRGQIYCTVTSVSKINIFLFLFKFIRKPVSVLYNILDYAIEYSEDNDFITKLAPRISSDLTVQQGVFKGMKYARANAAGSTLLPKLLGTYEIELSPVWKGLIDKKLDLVVDIGCAEGFYAVGCSLIFPDISVYAFDTNPIAQGLCVENAIANNVEGRIKVLGECTSTTLSELCSNNRGLVICDIEGGEASLFESTDLKCLKFCYLIIELHDGVDFTISEKIKRIFSASHIIESIYSTDDIQRPTIWSNYDLFNLNRNELFEAMKEKRSHIMEWVFLSPKI